MKCNIHSHFLTNIEAAVPTALGKTTWDQVIKKFPNCFHKAGFQHEMIQNEDHLTKTDSSAPEDHLPLNLLADILKNKNSLKLTDNYENLNPTEIQELFEDSDDDEVPIPTAIPN